MGGGFIYSHKHQFPNASLRKWRVTSGTSCRLIGQPTWNNLGSMFFKHNHYESIIDRLLDPDQNLYNVIHFCDNNPNCFQIEIDKKEFQSPLCPSHFGHHVFASSSVDLKKLINLPSVSASLANKNVTVKWICNYGQVQEAPLNQFLKMIQDLKTDTEKYGIVYKMIFLLSTSYAEHRHLSFLLDLRRYCGDVSRFNHVPDKIGPNEQLIGYVNKFHKKYVEPNTPPSQQIVWTFLQTFRSKYQYCLIIKNLNWDNVKNWDPKMRPVMGLHRRVLEFVHQSPETSSGDFVKTEIEQLQQFDINKQNQSATKVLVEKMISAESSFAPSVTVDVNASHTDQIGSLVHQFKAFLEKKHLVQNVGKLIKQMNSAPIEDHIIFAIYKQLFKTNIIKDLKNPDSKTINILSFLTQNVQKNGIVASISVPDFGEKRLILVVNNLGDVKEDELKPLLFDLVKKKGVPAPFANNPFSIFFDNQIHADLGSVEAFNLFKTIVPDENVDRIDGIVVTERAVRETATETWTDGVTAATRFLMLSHLFLTHYNYDNQNHKKVFKSDSNKKLNDLIEETTEMSIILRENIYRFAAVKDVQQEIERLTRNMFQLVKNLVVVLPLMPEGVELHADALKNLNHNLSSLIDSEILPKKSFN